MEKNTSRNWGVIYQQGWDLILKEKYSERSSANYNNPNAGKRKYSGKKEIIC